jgi:hypothetical protein
MYFCSGHLPGSYVKIGALTVNALLLGDACNQCTSHALWKTTRLDVLADSCMELEVLSVVEPVLPGHSLKHCASVHHQIRPHKRRNDTNFQPLARSMLFGLLVEDAIAQCRPEKWRIWHCR